MDCIFCKIISGNKREEIIYQDKELIVFADHTPRAKTHLLIVPKEHFQDYYELITRKPKLLENIGKVVKILADKMCSEDHCYTWGFHGGGKQTVNHVHAQFLSGMSGNELVM